MALTSIPSILENTNIPIYVVGSAYDGPDSIPVDLSYANNYKLLRQTEQVTISIDDLATTGTTLRVAPLTGSVSAEFSPWSSPKFIPTYWVDGYNVNWKPLGSSGTMYLKYTPVQDEDAILPITLALPVSSQMLRVRGERASGALCDWVFTARYSGEIYNGLLVSGSATSLIISGNSLTRVDHNGNLGVLKTLIENYSRFNDLPFTYTAGTEIPTGSVLFSGGTNGSLTDESFQDLIENIGGSYTGILLPAKKVTKQQILYFQYHNALMGYPLVLVATPESLDINGIAKSPDVILVYGDTLVNGQPTLPASVAYLQFLYTGNTYNFTPLSDAKLEVLASQGIIGFGKYGPYKNQSLDGGQALYKLVIGWILRNGYIGLIGTPKAKGLQSIDAVVTQKITALPFVKSVVVTSKLYRDSVDVGAVVTLFGEFRELAINVRAI